MTVSVEAPGPLAEAATVAQPAKPAAKPVAKAPAK